MSLFLVGSVVGALFGMYVWNRHPDWFIRFLRWVCAYEAQIISNRIHRLTDSFTDGYIDVHCYVALLEKMDAERRAAIDDVHRWDSALNALEIQG